MVENTTITQQYLSDFEFKVLIPLIEDYFDTAFLLTKEDYIQRTFEFSGKLPTISQIYEYVPRFIIAIEEEDIRTQYRNLGF